MKTARGEPNAMNPTSRTENVAPRPVTAGHAAIALRRPLLATLFALAGACSAPAASASRIAIVSSLRPVDTARPLVVFGQISGDACGNDAVPGALRNLKRLVNVDGYLEVVVEETGEGTARCAKATAYPFRYGTSTDTPGLRAEGESTSPVLIPGRPPDPLPAPPADSGAPAAFDCTSSCQAFAALVETGSIKQALAKDRCHVRCASGDPAFQHCIVAARTSEAARRCL
jgi:hypothetical protein